MTWFADMSPYTFFPLRNAEAAVPTLNVGWLELGRPFPTGEVPADFVARLALLVEHAPTQSTRGLHWCDLCPPTPQDAIDWSDPNKSHACGHAEIRAIGSDGTRFAAPTLVHHYVAIHRYAPPQAFVDAVMRAANVTWYEAFARDVCFACGAELERRGSPEKALRGGREPVLVVWMACHRCGTDYSRWCPATE